MERRPKKRPSFGVRTVELNRGQDGFGFTLQGQGPCKLSSIVENSPAFKARLKPGDHVIAVNSQNVSKISHDDVVSMIGNSTGLLKLQIAENYCSSSDDEDWAKNLSDNEEYMVPPPALPVNLRGPLHFRGNSADSTLTEASEILNNPRPRRVSPRKKVAAKIKGPQKLELQGGQELVMTEREISSFLHPTLDELRKSIKLNKQGLSVDLSLAVTKAVVGYLGTIEMPKENQVSLQAIRSCIRRLRVEKKVHTMVLMAIFQEKIVLINHHGIKLAEYPATQVSFCGKSPDNKQFFGLVTTRKMEDEEAFSSSCHVFMTEAVTTGEEVQRRASAFQFEPTKTDDPDNNDEYKEFPTTADPIIETIETLYKKVEEEPELEDEDDDNAYENISPPPPSLSNSDSGIGFKDGAVGGGVAPAIPPLPVVDPDPEESFNTERLESQNSADNLRQSMHRYLANKHQHLKKASEQLLNNRPSEFRQSLGLPPYQPPPRPPSVNEEKSSSVASSSGTTINMYKSNLVTKSHEELLSLTKDEGVLPSTNTQGILKPSDQYPCEPGVLKSASTSRPLSALSNGGVFMGNLAPRNDLENEASETELETMMPTTTAKASDAKGWSRSSSIRKHLRRRSFSSSRIDQVGHKASTNGSSENTGGVNTEDVTITDEKLDVETTSQAGSLASERGIDIGRVGSWATDFEKLLTDPIGLRTFAEFLKKEFSHENIYFWTACERYRKIKGDDEDSVKVRMATAEDILKRHLSSGAPEPVNVDSHARQAAHEGPPTAQLFATAQKQIYNLMKFDSFSRFLKSELYKDSLVAEMSGKNLPFEKSEMEPLLDIGEPGSSSTHSSLRNKDQTSSRRRSILPSFNLRSKDRSKSKDRDHSLEKNHHKKNSKSKSEQYHSMTSLTSQPEFKEEMMLDTTNESDNPEGGQNCALARVILPDKATTVVQTRTGESIRSMVARLLDKRALRYTSFDVFVTNSEKPLDLGEDSTSLGCTEVRVEPRVLFRLELPSKKSIGVKAKPAKLVKEVLGPILNQYGWNLEGMSVRRDVPNSHGGHVDPEVALVDLEATVASIDNSRLMVAAKTADINSELLKDLLRTQQQQNLSAKQKDFDQISRASSLDSIERNQRKQQQMLPPKSEEELMPPPEAIPNVHLHHRRALPKLNKPSAAITDDLYEGLKLAQRGRLEDQRGTEIKFEMPDFLKRGTNNKENFGPPPYQNPPMSLSHSRNQHRQSEPILPQPPLHHPSSSQSSHHRSSHHIRRDIFPDRLSTSSSYARLQTQPHSLDYYQLPSHNDSNFSHEGYLPSLQEADRYFGSVEESASFNASRLSLGMRYHNDPMYETLSQYRSNDRNQGNNQRRWSNTSGGQHQRFVLRREPPPLPPKPRLPPVPPHALRSTQSDVGMPNSRESSSHRDSRHHRDNGYSVSFV